MVAHTFNFATLKAKAGESLWILRLHACHDYAKRLSYIKKQNKQTNNKNRSKQAGRQAEKYMFLTVEQIQ